MMLFGLECKKIAGSILYWVLVLALVLVSFLQYEPVVEGELGRTGDPASVFYIAPDGNYGEERSGVPDEAMERAMMLGATERLLASYRENRYEYYPFGYIKEKTMSAQEQAVILGYLMELTGLSEQVLNGTADGTGGVDPGDVPISGPGAFVLEPGKGEVNGSGQFVIAPEDWQYVSGDGASPEAASPLSGGLEIQVSFPRFQEIMEEVSGLIGRNSYFSRTMLELYYFGSDMEDTPITQRQHLEFYEGDRVTGAFARYYCDCMSLAALCLPAFVGAGLMLRDKRRKMRGLLYPRAIASARVICTRYAAAVTMTMLPILILPVSSLLKLLGYCGGLGVPADALAFVKYILAWILPTVLLVVAVSLLAAVLLENDGAILLAGLLWLTGRPPVDRLAGGNYGLFDLIIRHNTLKGRGRMLENLESLVGNRLVISAAALALVGAAVLVYGIKRKGGLRLARQESACYHSVQLPSER